MKSEQSEQGERRPRLRFPEFEGVGGWKNQAVEDFFIVGSSKRILQKDWITQGIPFYRTRELVSLSKNERFRSEIFISEKIFSDLSKTHGVPTEGDFLVSGVGTLGIAYQVLADDKFYFKDGNVLWFKRRGGLNSTFFKYCFEYDEIQNQIFSQSSTSTVGTYTIQNAK
jgi:type I restriction enzyme, S subunit